MRNAAYRMFVGEISISIRWSGNIDHHVQCFRLKKLDTFCKLSTICLEGKQYIATWRICDNFFVSFLADTK